MEEDKENEIEERQEEAKKKYEKKEKIVKDKTDNFQKHMSEENKLLEKVRGNPWIISTWVCGALVLILLITNFGGITGNVSKDTAGQKLLDFYTANGAVGLKLNSVEKFSGYKIKFDYLGEDVYAFMSGDGKLGGTLGEISGNVQEPVQTNKLEGSTFEENDDEICRDKNGKPYVLLFSTTWCPHCKWIKDTFDGLAKENFSSRVNIQHWEIDIKDNTLTKEIESKVPEELMEYYNKYNPKGSIPTFVFGCRYTRIGNGYESQNDLKSELDDFKLITNKLLG